MTDLPVRGLDRAQLWDVTVVTDLVNGEVHVHTPITQDGDVDPARATLYRGRTQLAVQGPGGQQAQIPLVFDLVGPTLADALDSYEAALRKAVSDFEANMHRQRIMQGAREAHSRIDVSGRKPQ